MMATARRALTDRRTVTLRLLGAVLAAAVPLLLILALGSNGAALAVVAVLAGAAAVMLPRTALVGALVLFLADGWLERHGVPGVAILVVTTAVPVLVLLNAAATGRLTLHGRLARGSLLVLLLVIAYGALALFVGVSPLAVGFGARLIVLPVLYVFALTAVRGRWLVARLPFVLAVLALVSFAEGVRQRGSSVGSLEAQGFVQGVSIRFIDGLFRSPGLATTNYSFGLLSGALALYFVYCLRDPSRPRSRAWHVAVWVGLAAALGGAFVSTLRVTLVALLVAGGLVLLRARGVGIKVAFLTVSPIALVWGLSVVEKDAGLLSASSLEQRLATWRALRLPQLLMGEGLGAFGIAARVTDSDLSTVADNALVTLLMQFGLVGTTLLLVAAVAMTARRNSDAGELLPIAAFVAVCGMFIDVHEFTGVLVLVALTVEVQVWSRTPIGEEDSHVPRLHPEEPAHAGGPGDVEGGPHTSVRSLRAARRLRV